MKKGDIDVPGTSFKMLQSSYLPTKLSSSTTNHKSSHKWFSVSSSCSWWVILVCFLLVVVVVECGAGESKGMQRSLTTIENDTVGKVIKKEKSPGNNPNRKVTGKNALSSNDLDHAYTFNNLGDDDDANNHLHNFHDEDEDEDDEDISYNYDSFEDPTLHEDDSEFIKEHDDAYHLQGPPQIGKCCDEGYGLTLRGSCIKIKDSHHHHIADIDHFWFPERVYDVNQQKLVANNMSDWHLVYGHKFTCPEGERHEIIHDTKRFTVFKDGSLYAFDHQKLVPRLNYCLDVEIGKGQGRVMKACFTTEELCDDRQCLRKCCPVGSISEVVTDGPEDFRCITYTTAHEEEDIFQKKRVVPSNPTCSDGTRLEHVDPESFNVTENGTLVTSSFTAPFLSYCLDYFVDPQHSQSLQKQWNPTLTAMICFDGLDNRTVDAKGLIVVPYSIGVLLGIAMIFSAIFLAVAAAISWRLPELRSLHGKCQLSHLITMFFLYLCLAMVQLWTHDIPQGLCTFLGIIIHICTLSSFLWLNLLCVNIYLTFRSLRPPLAARRDENKRLIFLCIYAWGIPTAFCVFLYILDSSGRLDPMPAPEYGRLKCLLSNRQAEFAYLFGPVGVLLLLNGMLFCLTAQELLCGVWRLDNSDSINFRRKSMGIVVAKLGIVMGMGWVFDVLSWALAGSAYMFYSADLFNAFQGVFISLILLWRKRVLEVLHLRKPSIAKDETLTARPFLPKNGSVNASHADHDTSLVIVQET